MTNDDEIAILDEKIALYGVAGVAAYLSGYRPTKPINTAHVSNVKTRGRIGPTLRRAMVAAGWLPQPDPYPYFKIRRDDPSRAARQIIENLGAGFAARLVDALTVEINKPRPQRRITLAGRAKSVVIPADETDKN